MSVTTISTPRISKTAKGAIAAGAAVLLIGGAGTLAYWSDSSTVDGGTVNTGHLSIVPVGDTGTWVDTTGGGNAPITDISTYSIVPGDTLQYSRNFTVEAKGDNLAATVTATPLGTQSADITQWVTTTVSVVDGGAPTTQITDANDGDTITVNVIVAFDPDTPGTILSGSNAGDDDQVDLSNLAIQLQQTQGTATGN